MTRILLFLLTATIFLSAPPRLETGDIDDKNGYLEKWTEFYDQRYGLKNVFQKLTDNRGGGFEDLYGTRNFRVVLKGVVYRGGANNRWHRTDRRDNRNPLPEDGLMNLCREGFGRAYYLYTTNFDKAPGLTTCKSERSNTQELKYVQVNYIDERDSYEVLKAVHETIRNFRQGPVYIHCWNGWHASGYLSAIILRQFCSLPPEEAVRYWDLNTDGHNREPRYERLRQRIRDFTPYSEFKLSENEVNRVCF